MNGAEQIEQILKQYKEHGWTPRRALFAGKMDASVQALLEGLELVKTAPDSIWFSRRSRPDVETWELRRIASPPYAILAFIPDEAVADEVEKILGDAEARMSAATLSEEKPEICRGWRERRPF